jgi:hypothetical protein
MTEGTRRCEFHFLHSFGVGCEYGTSSTGFALPAKRGLRFTTWLHSYAQGAKRKMGGKRLVFIFLTVKSQLTQEPDVVLKQQADIGDSVFAHSEAFDAETEGKAGPFFGVYAAGGEDGGVDHAAAA